ncbi:hypothetical protein ACQP3C_30885, partial [Escherichia coli]
LFYDEEEKTRLKGLSGTKIGVGRPTASSTTSGFAASPSQWVLKETVPDAVCSQRHTLELGVQPHPEVDKILIVCKSKA